MLNARIRSSASPLIWVVALVALLLVPIHCGNIHAIEAQSATTTVTFIGTALAYHNSGGAAHVLTVSFSAGNYTIADNQPFSSTLPAGWTGAGTNTASGPAAGITDLSITTTTFAGADDVTISSTGPGVNVTIDVGKNLTLNASTIDGNLAANALTGDIVIAGKIIVTGGGSVSLTGDGSSVTLNADIFTSGAPITINDSVILGADILLDTTNAGGVPAGAGVTITGAVDATTQAVEGLTIKANAVDLPVAGTVSLKFLAIDNQATNIALGASNVSLAGMLTVDAPNGAISINGAITLVSGPSAKLTGQSIASNALLDVKENEGSVEFIATQGGVTDGNGAGLNLAAGNAGFGYNGNLLSTTVTGFDLDTLVEGIGTNTVSGTGDFILRSGMDGLNIQGVVSASDGDVSITTNPGGSQGRNVVINNAGAGSINASGTVTFTIHNFGALSDTGTNAAISGNVVNLINLGVFQGIGSDSANPLDLNATTLNASISSVFGSGIFINDTAGGVTIGNVTNSGGSGPIYLSSTGGDLILGDNSINANTGSVFLTTATLGGIPGTANGTPDVTANQVTFNTSGGPVGPLDMSVNAISATTMGGAVEVVDLNNVLTVNSIDTTGGLPGNVKVTLSDLSGGSDLLLGDNAIKAGAGNVTLVTTNGNIRGTAGGAVDITGATISLTAGGLSTTIESAGNPLEIDGITLNATTHHGLIQIAEANALAVNSATNSSGTSNISIVAGAGLTLNSAAVQADSGNVILNGGTGSITGPAPDGTPEVVGAQITFSAGGTLGTALEMLEIDGATLVASGIGGQIHLLDTAGGIVLGGTLSTLNGDITLLADDNATGITTGANAITAGNNGNIVLRSDLIDLDFGTVTGTGTLTLRPFLDTSSIGVAGAAGTLQIPTAIFSSLTPGFSQIIIGSATQSGTITTNALTIGDPLHLQASGINPGNTTKIVVSGALTGGGSVTLSANQANGDTMALNQAVTAGTSLTIQGASAVSLGVGTNLKANNGALNAFSNIGTLNLPASGTCTFTGLGDQSVHLAAISGAGSNLTINSEGGGQIDGALDLQQGALLVNLDTDGDGIETMTAISSLQAASISVNGAGGSDKITFNGNVTTTNGGLSCNLGTVNLGSGIDVTTTGGNINIIASGVINLAGSNDTVSIYSTGDIDFNSTVNDPSGKTAIRYFFNTDNSGINTLSLNNTTARNGISMIAGASGNDVYHLFGNLTTDGGAITFSNGGQAVILFNQTWTTELGGDGNAGNLNLGTTRICAAAPSLNLTINAKTTFAGGSGGSVTLNTVDNGASGQLLDNLTIDTNGGAAKGTVTFLDFVTTYINLTVQHAATVNLEQNWVPNQTLTATSGNLSMITGVGSIIQKNTFYNGGSMTFQTFGGSISLGAMSHAPGAQIANTYIYAARDVTLVSVSASSGSLTINPDLSIVGSTLTAGALSAGSSISVVGTSNGDTFNFNGPVTADTKDAMLGGYGIIVDHFGNANIGGNFTTGGATSLGTNDITFSNGGTIVIQNTVTWDTNAGNSGASGKVNVGGVPITVGNTASLGLTIDTHSDDSAAGNVTLAGIFPNVAVSLDGLTLNTGGTPAGTITLTGNYTFDKNAGLAPGFIVQGGGNIVLGNSMTILTNKDLSGGSGPVDLGDSSVSGNAPGFDLTINTSCNADFDPSPAGNVFVSRVDNAGGFFLNAFTINTLSAASLGTHGLITLKGDLAVSGNLISLNGPVALGASVTIDTSAGNGNIIIGGTLNADAAANNRSLTLMSGTGPLFFGGAVGGTQALDNLTITQSGGAAFGLAQNFTVNATAASQFTLNTAGANQSNGNIVAQNVFLNSSAAGNFNLANAGSANNIGHVAATVNGSVNVTNKSGNPIAAGIGATGISTNAHAVTLTTSGGAFITVNQPIDTGPGGPGGILTIDGHVINNVGPGAYVLGPLTADITLSDIGSTLDLTGSVLTLRLGVGAQVQLQNPGVDQVCFNFTAGALTSVNGGASALGFAPGNPSTGTLLSAVTLTIIGASGWAETVDVQSFLFGGNVRGSRINLNLGGDTGDALTVSGVVDLNPTGGIGFGASGVDSVNLNDTISAATASVSVIAGGSIDVGVGGVVTATSGDITLNATAHLSQNGALTTSGVVNLTASTDFMNLAGNISATTLNLTCGGGTPPAINQLGTSTLTVSGTTTLNATGPTPDINLPTASNNFGTLVVTAGRHVTLRDANSLIIGNVNATGAVILTIGAAGTATFTGTLSSNSASITASSGTGTLVMSNTLANTFTISAANSGQVSNANFTIAVPPSALTFSSMASLSGGTGSDFFNFGAGGSLAGNIDGGLGIDLLDNSVLPGAIISKQGPGTLDGSKGTATGIGGLYDNLNNNLAPTIASAPTANPSVVILPGTTSVDVLAGDPDNDPLTYTWDASVVPSGGVATFSPPGASSQSSRTVSFNVEGVYTLRVTVSDGALSVQGTVNVTVMAGVAVTASDSFAVESGNPGEFTITRAGSTTGPLSVHYTMSGTAVNGTDYSLLNGTATILAGNGSVTVPVTPLQDGATEFKETVILTIATDPAYGIGTPDHALVDLFDDEVPLLSITALDPSAGEPSDNGSFTITRVGGPAVTLTVKYTVGGTASIGGDYTLASPPASQVGTAVIPSVSNSVAVNLTVIDDGLAEPAETVILTLFPQGTYQIGPSNQATVTITDNENHAPQILGTPFATPDPVRLPRRAFVDVSATDQDAGQTLTYTWTKVSGPGTVTFDPAGSQVSSSRMAAFSLPGNYVLRVTVSDGIVNVTGDVPITVLAPLGDASGDGKVDILFRHPVSGDVQLWIMN